MSASRQAAWRSRRSSAVSSRPVDAMKRSVQAISSSPWAGERERSTLSSLRGGDQRILAPLLGVEHRIEQPLAHAERGDHDVLRPRDLAPGSRAPARHRRAAAGGRRSTTSICDSVSGSTRCTRPAEVVRLSRRHHIAVHHMQRIAGLPHVQPRERAPGAADGVEGAALGPALSRLRVAERLARRSSRPS